MKFSKKQTRLGLSIATTLTAIILVTGVIIPAMNQAYAMTSFGGRAIAMSVSTPLGATTYMDTGQLSSGDEADATPTSIQTPLATADGLLSVTTSASQSASQSALGELVLLPGNPNKITAYFAMAQSQASCSNVSGSSDITSLTMGGKTIPITGQPNQVVSVPGVLSLTINEQIINGNSITVNALHLHTTLGADVIISSASSSASCSTLGTLGLNLLQPAFGWGVPSQPGCVDFTTGGGWVKPPPNKGTFGFVAGYKNGGDNPRGNLEYHDHTIDMNVHSEDVLYYNCGSFDNSRVFGGHAEVNHSSGYCYQVYVQDNGEPGTDTDYYAMWIWSPPTDCPTDGSVPSGTPIYAVGNYLGGGNIQLHAK